MLKYLRIAVTALSLTACVLLIALWVRSYWWCDLYNRQESDHISRFRVISMEGRIHYIGSCMTVGSTEGFKSYPIDHVWFPRNEFVAPGEAFKRGSAYRFTCRYLSPVLLGAFLSAAPWIPWRFSLRTLLIATTLIAVGLGTIIYRAR
jgi:hypothetical protein